MRDMRGECLLDPSHPTRRRQERRSANVPVSSLRTSMQTNGNVIDAAVARAGAGHLSLHIPDGGEHGYGDEEEDREDDHHMVGHHAPES